MLTGHARSNTGVAQTPVRPTNDNHQLTSYLSGRDNLFAKSSTGVRYEIGDDLFYLTMSLNVDYERDPPPGVQTDDSTWVVGVGFEF